MNTFFNELGIYLVSHLGWLSVEMVLLAVGVLILLQVMRVTSAAVKYAFWSLVFIKPCVSLLFSTPIVGSGINLFWDANKERVDTQFEIAIASVVVHMPELDYYGVIGLCWMLVFLILVVRLIVGSVLVQFLCQQAQTVSSGLFYETVLQGCRQLKIRRSVGVRISSLVQGPMVCGVFFPVILLPKEMVRLLDLKHIEYVILHELAHVRRMDNLFLILERVIETVLFFHPVVWLCGRVMRREAEYACDDWVVRASSQPMMYADCMVRVAEMSRVGGRGLLAYPFLVGPSLFARRVRRLSVKNFTRSSFFSGKRALVIMPAIIVFGLPRITMPPVMHTPVIEEIRKNTVSVQVGSVWGKTQLVSEKVQTNVASATPFLTPEIFRRTMDTQKIRSSLQGEDLSVTQPRLYEFVSPQKVKSNLVMREQRIVQKSQPVYQVDLSLLTLRQLGHYIDREEENRDIPFFWILH